MGQEPASAGLSRRRFVQGMGAVGLALGAGCGPWAWPARRVYRVGLLTTAASTTGPCVFREALRELGDVEPENLILETRLQAGPADLGAQVRELVELRMDVLVTAATFIAQAATAETGTIPIVSVGAVGDDLIEAGLAASLARPGANVTGLTPFDADLTGKRLQLLTEVAPGTARVAILWATPAPFPREPYAQAAELLGVQLQVVEMQGGDEVEHAFEATSRARGGAVGTSRSAPRPVALADRGADAPAPTPGNWRFYAYH